MMKLDNFIGMMTGHFDNKEQFNMMQATGKIYPCLLYTSRTKVEETGGANFLFVTKDGTVVTPKSDSILPSITRRSLMIVAEKYLDVYKRQILRHP